MGSAFAGGSWEIIFLSSIGNGCFSLAGRSRLSADERRTAGNCDVKKSIPVLFGKFNGNLHGFKSITL